jgi:dimethylargininase
MTATINRGIAFVRAPSSRLADGLVTYVARRPVDLDLARAQHRAYRDALGAAGWSVRDVEPADDCPDSVFVEDTVIVCDGVAVITRSGAPQRRPETVGTESAVRAAGLELVRIVDPGTLDGGDVLQVGATVYVGRGGRTNADGIRQLRSHLAPLGRTVVPVRLRDVLHLKSAVTALPDGTFLALPDRLDASVFPTLRAVTEEAGAHVLPLGDDLVLMAASAPRTAEQLSDLGFAAVVVDIGEFEKLEGCVTCLSVLVPRSTGRQRDPAHGS